MEMEGWDNEVNNNYANDNNNYYSNQSRNNYNNNYSNYNHHFESRNNNFNNNYRRRDFNYNNRREQYRRGYGGNRYRNRGNYRGNNYGNRGNYVGNRRQRNTPYYQPKQTKNNHNNQTDNGNDNTPHQQHHGHIIDTNQPPIASNICHNQSSRPYRPKSKFCKGCGMTQEGKTDDDEQKYSTIAKPTNVQKKKVSLVFVGETGVGKTTLLQSLADFINGVPFESVECTDKPEATGFSQTMDTKQYQLSNDEWAVNIIDTPGIGDTSGVAADVKHMDNIVDFLGNYGDFNAVCILLKRGTARLTTRMQYIVNELKSNMPKDVQSNFVVVMTRSDVPVPDKDTMAVINGLKLPSGNIIPINNVAYEELDVSQYPADSPIIKVVQSRQKTDYVSNHQHLQILLETACKMTLYEGHKMKSLKVKRDKLKEDVGLLKMTIDDSFKVEKQFKEQLAAFEKAKSEAALNEAYNESNEHIEYDYYKETGKITTSCNACSRACHINCHLSYGDDLNRCWCAGSGGNCKVCGHSVKVHTHLGWKSRSKKVTKTVTNEGKKLKFMEAEEKKKVIQQRKKELNDNLKNLDKKRDKCTKEIQSNYAELQEIAIIGYNESFEQYMTECKKAVEKDGNITREEKEERIGMFTHAISTFQFFKDAIKGKLQNVVNSIFYD